MDTGGLKAPTGVVATAKEVAAEMTKRFFDDMFLSSSTAPPARRSDVRQDLIAGADSIFRVATRQ